MAMSSCKAETQGEIRDFLVTPHIFSIEGGSTSLAPDETVPHIIKETCYSIPAGTTRLCSLNGREGTEVFEGQLVRV